jgi:hypothetical protein
MGDVAAFSGWGERVGAWQGTNGFRLMASDPLVTRPASATVSVAAGSHLLSLAYGWEHPDDGPQDGLLVVGEAGGDGEAGGSLVAWWGDSWHQQPEPRTLSGGGGGAGNSLALSAEYGGGWSWNVLLDVDGPALRLRMQNVVPAGHDGPAGPYDVMIMSLLRSSAS